MNQNIIRDYNETGDDARNVISWRVPNTPKENRVKDEEQDSISNKLAKQNVSEEKIKIDVDGKQTKFDYDHNFTPRSNQRVIDSSPNLFTTKLSTKDRLDNEQPSNLNRSFQNRLWKILHANLNRAIDELYQFCEEEEHETYCRDASETMQRGSRDFIKLVEKFQVQKQFDLEDENHPAMSWEVRKPTATLSSSNTFQGSSPILPNDMLRPSHSEVDVRKSHGDHKHLPEKTTVRANLRANAEPFHPSHSLQNKEMDTSNEKNIHNPKLEKRIESEASVDRLKITIPGPADADDSFTIIESARPDQKTESSRREMTWEEWWKSEVTVASEPVWAEVEAWVEREAMAEEHEWLTLTSNDLKLKQNFPIGRDGIELKARIASYISSNLATSSVDGGTGSKVSQAVRQDNTGEVAFSPTMDSSQDDDPSHYLSLKFNATPSSRLSSIRNSPNKVHQNQVRNGLSFDEDTASSRGHPFGLKDLLSRNHPLEAEPSYTFSTPTGSYYSPLLPKSSNRSPDTTGMQSLLSIHHKSMGHDQSNLLHGQYSPSVITTPAATSGNSGGRSLHDKLSSPDRKKSLSPTEAKRALEARQLAAESNRDKSVMERVQKAMKVSTRVKLRGEREQLRIAKAEQDLEAKLRDAELRHEEYIKQIKGKAGNENTKVNEVIFINALNSETMAEQLQQKLDEVEGRILAASERRRERLDGIKVQQRRKNSRKAQQMSELRLQLERQKMERWEKLQKRLHAVQLRRQVRLEEIKRRAETNYELTLADVTINSIPARRNPMIDEVVDVNESVVVDGWHAREVEEEDPDHPPSNPSTGGTSLLILPAVVDKASSNGSSHSTSQDISLDVHTLLQTTVSTVVTSSTNTMKPLRLRSVSTDSMTMMKKDKAKAKRIRRKLRAHKEKLQELEEDVFLFPFIVKSLEESMERVDESNQVSEMSLGVEDAIQMHNELQERKRRFELHPVEKESGVLIGEVHPIDSLRDKQQNGSIQPHVEDVRQVVQRSSFQKMEMPIQQEACPDHIIRQSYQTFCQSFDSSTSGQSRVDQPAQVLVPLWCHKKSTTPESSSRLNYLKELPAIPNRSSLKMQDPLKMSHEAISEPFIGLMDWLSLTLIPSLNSQYNDLRDILLRYVAHCSHGRLDPSLHPLSVPILQMVCWFVSTLGSNPNPSHPVLQEFLMSLVLSKEDSLSHPSISKPLYHLINSLSSDNLPINESLSPSHPNDIHAFITVGGLLLFRLLLGPECGVLRSTDSIQHFFSQASPPHGHEGSDPLPTHPLKPFRLVVFDKLQQCVQYIQTQPDQFSIQLHSFGLCAMASDWISFTSILFDTCLSSSDHLTTPMDGPTVSSSIIPASVIQAISTNLYILSSSFLKSSLSSGSIEPSMTIVLMDSFAWFLIVSPQLSIITTFLQRSSQLMLDDLTSGRYPTKPTESIFSIASTSCLCFKAIALLLSESAGIQEGVTFVQSYNQFTSHHHRHPKGRLILSLIRRNNLVPTFAACLQVLIRCHHQWRRSTNRSSLLRDGPSSLTSLPALTTTEGERLDKEAVVWLHIINDLVEALVHFARSDIGLLHQLSIQEQALMYLLEWTNDSRLYKRDHSSRFRSMQMTLSALCLIGLRNPTIQKVCGQRFEFQSMDVSYEESGPHPLSLLQYLVLLSSDKVYKDKRYGFLFTLTSLISQRDVVSTLRLKPYIIGCLICLSMDIDTNVHLIKTDYPTLIPSHSEKLSSPQMIMIPSKSHYIEKYLASLELEMDTIRSSCPSGSEPIPTIKAIQFSQLIPFELWSVASVAFSSTRS